MPIFKDDPRHTILFEQFRKSGKLSKKQMEKAMENALVYFTEHGYPPYDSFDVYLNSLIKTFEGILSPEQVILFAAEAIEKEQNLNDAAKTERRPN